MEMLDVIDGDDRVVGMASKKDVYEKSLPHRIVHVFVFNSDGKLALQKSSMQKSYCPLHWGTTAGGHVQTGETAEKAALREFEEEVGVRTGITFVSKDWFTGPRGIRKLLTTFRTEYDGPFKLKGDEVEKVEFFSMEQMRDMVRRGEKFHPELLFLLRKHFGFA